MVKVVARGTDRVELKSGEVRSLGDGLLRLADEMDDHDASITPSGSSARLSQSTVSDVDCSR